MADLEKIRKLLTKLDEGKDVSLRDLKGALGDDGVREYEGRWQNELEYRQNFETKPVEIKNYEALLHQADFYESRADAMTHIGKRSKKDLRGRSSRERLYQQAESKYEQALEYLDGVIGLNPRYAIWFDRPLDFTLGTTLSIDGQGMPRTITSRSKHSLSSGVIAQRTKVVVKREVLEAALERLERERSLGKDGVLGQADGVLLKQKLAAFKRTIKD